MPNGTQATGRYLCSQEAYEKAQSYLNRLKTNKAAPGSNLRTVLKNSKFKLNTLTTKDFLACLMNTRFPRKLAESTRLGDFWTVEEIDILSDIAFSTTGTYSYNNGAHKGTHTDHEPPPTNLLFVSSALLRNDKGFQTRDRKELIEYGDLGFSFLNSENFYKLVKVVAWDPCSCPGNDIWANEVSKGNFKDTDDGVTFASTDALLAFNALWQYTIGRRRGCCRGISFCIFRYNEPKHGCHYHSKLWWFCHVTWWIRSILCCFQLLRA